MATAQNIIDSVRRLISDETASAVSGLRWSDAELLTWIAEAQREIVKLKPEAYPVTVVHEVDPASARQRLDPVEAYRIIRVEGNAA